MESPTNFHAVIMGFNEFSDEARLPSLKFAEKDARDLYDLLTNLPYGKYPSQNITLITGTELRMQLEAGVEYPERIVSLVNGDIPITQMKTSDIETILYTQLVNNRTSNDIVFVYYSGHGFIAGAQENAYLATPDVSILNIQSNPRAGLQMKYLHSDIFMDTKAKFVVFLLDCCHSGAFCRGLENRDEIDIKHLVEARYYSGEGRVAFVSSPRGIVSRESKDYQNGVFTHHLLNGLQGAAIEPSGEVTIASLVSYVQRMSPVSQPPVLYGNTTRIVLAKYTDTIHASKPTYNIYSPEKLPFASATKDKKSSPLSNPLDEQIRYVSVLLDCLKAISQDNSVLLGNRLLSAIRCSLDAEFSFVLRIETNENGKNIIYKYQSDLAIKGSDFEEYKTLVMGDLYPLLERKRDELISSKYGFFKLFEGRKDTEKYLVAIPLRIDSPREFLIVCGVAHDALKYGTILGRSVRSVYESTTEFTSLNLSDVETTILDDIKRDFGHVPSKFYDHRFKLFTDKLSSVYFVFEPVILLGKHRPEIHSWEALARDPTTETAPFQLFKSAELWGPEFITALDLYCLQNATGTYIKLWEHEHPDRKGDSLAINVYPETLFQPDYKSAIKQVVEAENIINNRLILEISEKRPIPSASQIGENIQEDADPVDLLISKVHEYTNEFQIGFAIDDFGVGHSSVTRLIKLELDHIKIDRDILLHSHPEITIGFVRDIVKAAHAHPFTIIVEGFDGASRLSLKQIYDLSVRHVQGHMIRKARSSLADLSQDEKTFIINELAGNNVLHWRERRELT